MRTVRRDGFTLVELLVVIGIIGILMAILMPALSKARDAAAGVKCAAAVRSLGQGFASYLAENRQTFPAAYIYRPSPSWKGPRDQFPVPTYGYIHWSSYIYGDRIRGAMADAFKCPALDNGGLPPTNPHPGEGDDGQVNDPDFGAGAEPDAQVARCAYTVNEAIMPRNKFNPGIRGASTSPRMQYSYVKASDIRRAADVILATEFAADWRIVSQVGDGDAPVVKSHRPVSGYQPIIGKSSTDLVDGVVPASASKITHVRVKSVTNPVTATNPASNTLGWIGRNHGQRKGPKGENLGKSVFLYVDGHVETKTVEETLSPVFQWGDPTKIYSLPNARVAP